MLPEAVDLKKLKAFQLVAQHSSLRIAAARLRLTIPAVSFQIRRLEEDLETQLFRRLPNGLALTPAGENFVREVEDIFKKVESALQSLPSKAPPSGQLSIALSPDVVWYFTPRISSFIKKYPGVRLHNCIFHSGEIIARLCRGDLDAGIGFFAKVPRTIQQEVVVESTLTLACAPGHPLLRRRPLRLEDLAHSKLLLLPQQSETRKMLDRTLSEAGVRIDDAVEAGSCHTARDFAQRGVGAAIVHSICMAHNRPDNLRYVDLGNQFSKVEFSVIYRKDAALTAPLRGFLETITSDAEG